VAQADALTTNAANRVMAIARLTLVFILIVFESDVAVLHTLVNVNQIFMLHYSTLNKMVDSTTFKPKSP
jgi:hypothetical protein